MKLAQAAELPNRLRELFQLIFVEPQFVQQTELADRIGQRAQLVVCGTQIAELGKRPDRIGKCAQAVVAQIQEAAEMERPTFRSLVGSVRPRRDSRCYRDPLGSPGQRLRR